MIGENNLYMRTIKTKRNTYHKKVRKHISTSNFRRTPWNMLLTVFILALFGLAMIFNVSGLSALNDFGDKFHYLKEQSQWLAVGTLVLIFSMYLDYKKLAKLSVILLVITFGFLIAVFLPGIGIHVSGASRWINLGFFALEHHHENHPPQHMFHQTLSNPLHES